LRKPQIKRVLSLFNGDVQLYELDDATKVYVCQYCGRKFTKEASVTGHLARCEMRKKKKQVLALPDVGELKKAASVVERETQPTAPPPRRLVYYVRTPTTPTTRQSSWWAENWQYVIGLCLTFLGLLSLLKGKSSEDKALTIYERFGTPPPGEFWKAQGEKAKAFGNVVASAITALGGPTLKFFLKQIGS